MSAGAAWVCRAAAQHWQEVVMCSEQLLAALPCWLALPILLSTLAAPSAVPLLHGGAHSPISSNFQVAVPPPVPSPSFPMSIWVGGLLGAGSAVSRLGLQ